MQSGGTNQRWLGNTVRASEKCVPAVRASVRRLSARLLLLPALAMGGGCGAGHVAATKPSADAIAAGIPELERRVRVGDAKGAVALAAALRDQGPVAPRVLALQCLAQWALGDPTGGRSSADGLVARAISQDPDALLAVEQLLTAHLAAGRDAEAMRLGEPLFAGGCQGAARCALALRLLTAAKLDDATLQARAQAMAPPIADTNSRQRWLSDLARALADAGRDTAHEHLVRGRLREDPTDVTAWAALLYRAPRSRGAAVRDAWLRDVQAAALSTAVLRALVRNSDVLDDPLIVNDLHGLIGTRADASAEDWRASIAALGASAARGADPRATVTLQQRLGVAALRLTHGDDRRELVAALLAAKLLDEAKVNLAPLLAEAPVHPESLVLLAELLRLRGDLDGAKAAAQAAHDADLGRASGTAASLAARWAGSWPEQARAWSAIAAKAQVGADDSALRQRVARLLGSYQPPASAEVDLRAYGILLDRDIAAGRSAARSELRQHADRLARLLPRGAWLQLAADALAGLCASANAEATTCAAASEARVRQRDRNDALRLWRLAAESAATTGAVLPVEAVAAAWVHVGDAHGLAAWLRQSELRATADLALSWRLALTLASGGEQVAARPWIHASLARITGSDVLLSTLPTTTTAAEPTGGPRIRVTEAELEVIARNGGADLVLRHLALLYAAATERKETGARWRYARLEALALAQVGRGDEAHRLLERMAAVADLSVPERTDLADLAARLHHCDVALDVATSLASSRWQESRRVIQIGVRCAQSSQDAPRLAALADRVAKANIEFAVHLEFAQLLAQAGADLLAAAWFQRLLSDGRGSAVLSHHLTWAQVLLRLGRPGDADEVIAQTLSRSRGQSLVIAARDAARLLVAHERVEAAVAVLESATQVVDHPLLRSQRTECLLRIGDVARLTAALDAQARAGLDQATLSALLTVARATRTVGVLHQALQGLQDVDREVERFRLEVAAAVQDALALDAAVQRLRTRGSPPSPAAVEALAALGRWRQSRQLADELLAGADASGAPARDEREAMSAALAVRRDPTSVDEAVAIGRLALARSSEPTFLAMTAAELMARAGAKTAALALAAHVVDSHGNDALVLYDAGVIALLVGDRARAVSMWRQAMARTLAEPFRSDGRGTIEGLPHEIAVIIARMQRAGETTLLRQWLPLWIDQRPNVPQLWAEWVRAEIDGGAPQSGLSVLRRASQQLTTWPAKAMRDVARELLRAGVGPALAALLVSGGDLQRNDPWWLAFGLSIVLDYGDAIPVGARQAYARSTQATLMATPGGRAWLARFFTERGQVADAVAALGARPFGAVHLDSRTSSDAEDVAATVAGVLVATLRQPALKVQRGDDPQAHTGVVALHVVDPARQREALLLAERWLHGAPLADAMQVVAELALHGHSALGQAILARVARPDGKIAPLAPWMIEGLRAVVAGGDATEIAAFADRCVHARVENGATYDLAARRREIALLLMTFGQPQLAEAMVQHTRRAPAITGLWVPAGDEGTATDDGALQRFEPEALRKAPAKAATATQVAAFEVAVAKADGDAALAIAQRAMQGEDEPWHLRATLVRLALRWRQPETARALLQRAHPDAPPLAFGCAHLALGSGDVAGCVRGRPAVALDSDELAALAEAIGRGDVAASKVADELVGCGELGVQARWLGALAERLGDAAPDAKARGAKVATALLAGVANGARVRLSATSLDELAALGMPEFGVRDCEAAWRAEPHDHGALNNLAYARLLAGAEPASLLPMAFSSLAVLAGSNAHALLDTLGALALAMGDVERARTWQKASVAAAPVDLPPTLPHVRLAEIELRAGHIESARLLAAWVLRRGAAGAYVDGRARAVIRAALRSDP